MKNPDNFEDLIKGKVESFEGIPSEEVWNQLDKNITTMKQSNTTFSNWVKIMSLIGAGVILSGLLYLTLSENTSPAIEAPKNQSLEPKVIAVKSPRDIKLQSFIEARDQAKKEGKLILLNVFLKECRFCIQMDKETFPHPEVADFMKKHFVKMDIDLVEKEYRDMMQYYGINAAPLFLFLNEKGQLIDKIAGFRVAEDFITLMESVLEKNAEGTYIDMESILQSNSTIKEVFSEASNQNKQVLVNIYSEGCDLCEELFENEAVLQTIENNYIPLNINLSEEEEAYKSFLRFHNVWSGGKVLILNNNGSLKKDFWEYPSSTDLLSYMGALDRKEIQPSKDAKLSVSIAPNPNDGNFMLHLEGKNAPATLRFIELDGREMLSEKLSDFDGKRSVQYDFSGQLGHFIVQFVQGEEVVTEKVIVQ